MSLCLAINVAEGLVGIADTRVISGNETIVAKKLTTYEHEKGAMFVMTSGLRSVRDKALTYFEERIHSQDAPHERLYESVNEFADDLRQVMKEDKEVLEESGLSFNLHALIGGQFCGDGDHKLYLVYPQGNWVEIGRETPFQIIGASGYGKPVLDRTINYEDSMRYALKVGCLAFDATRVSAADVDFPIDVLLFRKDTFQMVVHRFEKEDMNETSLWWQSRLRESINELPSDWMDAAFCRLRF